MKTDEPLCRPYQGGGPCRLKYHETGLPDPHRHASQSTPIEPPSDSSSPWSRERITWGPLARQIYGVLANRAWAPLGSTGKRSNNLFGR